MLQMARWKMSRSSYCSFWLSVCSLLFLSSSSSEQAVNVGATVASISMASSAGRNLFFIYDLLMFTIYNLFIWLLGAVRLFIGDDLQQAEGLGDEAMAAREAHGDA